ncbi:GAF and ANTAR domain-containing protein [Couchioplanes azureus]|uniref:GAF and ANTAR domain-containing protein n=1 Tax=Couchioplanes caeruleus TaxID=56438 RepID=UPI0019A76ADD|nr:GAF and ANTAR domain-containing protein [Couchioplanes caeruleus]GGQ71563.1 transcriptional regulator [Couchioplanes caeruleus subsp. azureus]
MTNPQAMKPTDAFAELGRIRFTATDLRTALATVAGLAQQTIPGADDVSVTLVGAQGAHTAAFTGQRATAVDEWQYHQGHGPCLAAAAANITVSVPDLAGDGRWPHWAARAIDAGVHSSMSVGLPLHDSVSGAFNVYATKPHAFDDDAVILAETFAGYAAVAMANAHLYDSAASLADHTQAAMDSRAVIEQAKGIIMAERRCTDDEAFTILANVSQDSGRKLSDVAGALVASAVHPRYR